MKVEAVMIMDGVRSYILFGRKQHLINVLRFYGVS